MAHRVEVRIREVPTPTGKFLQRVSLLTTHDRWAMVRVKGNSTPFVIELAAWDACRLATDEERRTPNEHIYGDGNG